MAGDKLTDGEWKLLAGSVDYYETVLEDDHRSTARLNRAWRKIQTARKRGLI